MLHQSSHVTTDLPRPSSDDDDDDGRDDNFVVPTTKAVDTFPSPRKPVTRRLTRVRENE